MLDELGNPLCSHIAWGRKCKWGLSCQYSHEVPSVLLASLAEQKERQHLEKCALVKSKSKSTTITKKTINPPWLVELKRHAVLISYDTSRYPFREAVESLLALSTSTSTSTSMSTSPSPTPLPLDELHNLPLLPLSPTPLSPTFLAALQQLHGPALPAHFAEAANDKKRGKHPREKLLRATPEYKRFLEIYDRFAREVLAPNSVDPSPSSSPSTSAKTKSKSKVVAQFPPTLRVFLAGQDPAAGKIGQHKDRVYRDHQASEINFWWPVNGGGVEGTNSLFIESEDGAEDFTSVDCKYGEVLRFNGERSGVERSEPHKIVFFLTNSTQHNTTQHNTTQHNTTQH